MNSAMSDQRVASSKLSLGDAPGQTHDHIVQLYTKDQFLMDVLGRFIGGALAMGDGAVVVATAAHHKDLARLLSARGLDTTKASSEGRYVAVDAAETMRKFLVHGAIDEVRFKDTIGGILTRVRSAIHKDSRVAVFGELVALLWAEGKTDEAARVEQFWNALASVHSFSLLCAYPMAGFNHERHIEPFLKICEQHSGVVPTEGYLMLGNEDERMRSIAQLQQKAYSLEEELALRESEAKFRLLVEAVRDYAIFMLDPEGNITSWNLGAERIKGYKGSDIIGRHFSCFYPAADVESGKPRLELAIAAKEGRLEDEGWRLRKDGSKFWANVIITAIRDGTGKLLGFAKVTRDVTDKMKAQKALREEVAERREAQSRLSDSQRSLRELSLHLLRTQDEERRRIGRDLHDSLGQYLAVLKMKLDTLTRLVERQPGGAALDIASQCLVLAEDSIKELRTVSYILYPPMLEEMGLKSAIPWYLDGFSARSGIKTTFQIQTDCGRFPRDGELALFRVLQESLTNVHRHSGSKIAHVRLLTQGGMGVLEIEDEGKGIPSELLEQSGQDWMGALGVGLRGMNERMSQLGGTLQLVRKEGGTLVRAAIPANESSQKGDAIH